LSRLPLFAFNKASSRAKLSARGCETPPLNKNPTERKYTFSLAASMARITLLEHWPLISDITLTELQNFKLLGVIGKGVYNRTFVG
jgi:hypothetical protein